MDGTTRLKPFIVFKGAKRKSKALHDKFHRQCSVVNSANGWMNEELTLRWYNEILGQFSWDSCETHLTDNVKKALTISKIEAVIIQGGCTKDIQAPDIVWNKPFKVRIEEFYNDWLAHRKHK